MNPAPFERRVMAGLVDYGAPQAAAWLVWFAGSFAGDSVSAILLVLFPLASIWTALQKVAEGRTSQSLGKRLAGVRLVRLSSGEAVGVRAAIIRWLLHALDALPCGLGFLMPLWHERRQTIADRLMKTVVVLA